MSNDESLSLWVIGDNGVGELGLHHKEYVKELTSWNLVNTELNIKEILTTQNTIIYIDHDNQHWVSGWNASGQCGINHNDQITTPTKLSYFDSKFIKISKIFTNSCGRHTFWLTSDNKLYCNGNNEYVTYRENKKDREPQSIEVQEKGKIMKIRSAKSFWMALIQSSNKYEITAIISNWVRLLNIVIPDDIFHFFVTLCSTTSVLTTIDLFKDKQSSSLFHKIKLFDDENVTIIDIDCGGHHCLFLDSNGNVWSFGWEYNGGNGDGQLGHGHNNWTQLKKPQMIEYFKENEIKIKSLACGWLHSLAVDEKGAVYSWGYNDDGQCGDCTRKSIFTPTLMEKFIDIEIIEVKCGTYHSYVKSVDGKHWLFGGNFYNQCLAMENVDRILEPTCIDDAVIEKVDGKQIKSVYLGGDRTCVVC